jgi:hypothetical protein
MIKIGIMAAACFGAYVFIGSHVHAANNFAFGLDGLGFTYLALATGVVGLVTYKYVK